MAHRLGITMVSPWIGNQPSGEPYGASLTLGAAEVSPLDMAAAFSVLALAAAGTSSWQRRW